MQLGIALSHRNSLRTTKTTVQPMEKTDAILVIKCRGLGTMLIPRQQLQGLILLVPVLT